MPNKKRKTAASSPRAHQQRKQAVPQRGPEDPSESVSRPPEGRVATEGAIGRSIADKQGVEWPAANLVRHPPGSNGGVHRGPDKGIRRNVVRAIFMGALTDEGVSLEDLRRRRKHRKGKTLVPMAIVHRRNGTKPARPNGRVGQLLGNTPTLAMWPVRS